MNGWLGGWTDRQTDGWMDKWVDECMNACMQISRAKQPSPEEVRAQQEEELQRQLPKLPRPTMASRTDTSISLNLNRGNKDEGGQGDCEVSWHALHDPIWVSKEGNSSGGPFTCSGLQPGTKYVVKARAGTSYR